MMSILLRRRAMIKHAENAPSYEATCVNDKYIQFSDGKILANAYTKGYFYTSGIPVKRGQVASVYCKAGTAVSVISQYNGEGQNCSPFVRGGGTGEYKTYSYTATEDCYISISANTDEGTLVTIDGVNVNLI